MPRKTIRVVGIAVAVVALVGVAAVLTLKLLFPPQRIKAMVIPQVEKALGRRVAIDKAGISLFPYLGVELKGLSVSETQRAGFDTTAFLSVGELEIRISVMALLRRSIDITTIRLFRPYVRVAVDSLGAYNFDDMAILAKKPDAAQKEKPATGIALPLPLSLRRLTIAEGKVEYINLTSRQTISVDSIGEWLSMSADRTMEHVASTGEISLKNIVLKTPQTAKPLRGLALTLRHDVAVNLANGSASIKALRLSLQDVYVNVTGTVTGLQSSPRYDLTVTTDTLSLEKLLAAVPPDLVPPLKGARGSGALYLKVLARGGVDSASPPMVDGTLNVWNGLVQYPGLAEAVRDIRANISFTTDKVSLAPLALKLGANPIDITGTIEHFAKPSVDIAMNATVNLGDMKNVIKLPPGNALDGVVKATVAAKGLADPSDPAKLDVKGSVQLSQVAVQTSALAKPAVFNGMVDFTSRQISPVFTLDIASSKISVSATLVNYLTLVFPDSAKKYPRPKLDIRVTSARLNTNEFLPENAESQKKDGAPAAAQPPSLLLPAPLPGIDIIANITTATLLYQDFELRNFKMNYSMLNDRMQATTQSGIFDGSLTQTLSVDAANISDLKVTSSLKLEQVEISRILSSTKKWLGNETALSREMQKLDKHLYGRSNAAVNFYSHGGTMPQLMKNLNGTVALQLVNGRIAAGDFISRISGPLQKLGVLDLKDIEFRQMSLTARIKDEKVYFDDISIGSPATGDWKAAGIVGFNGSMGVDLTNRLPSSVSGILSKGRGALASAAQGVLSKTPLAQASGLVDQIGPRPDKEGRYTIRTKLGGLLPGFSVDAFQFVDGGATAQQQTAPSPKAALQQQVQQKVEQVQEQAKEAVQQHVEQVQEKAAAEVKKSVETGKKKAMDLLKKF